MAFGVLGIAKAVLEAAPKYTDIVEPFADGGTLAMTLAKKPPKTHIANYTDETKYNIMLFLQQFSASDKKAVKGADWVSSQEAFDAALSIPDTALGFDLFYKTMYLKKFGVMSKDKEAPPTWDWTTVGVDMSGKDIILKIPVMRSALKKITLTLDDPMSVLKAASGSSTYVVIVPKTPEDIEAVERVLPIASPYYYAKKVKELSQLEESLSKNGSGGTQQISQISAGSVMPGMMEVRVNFDAGLPELFPPGSTP